MTRGAQRSSVIGANCGSSGADPNRLSADANRLTWPAYRPPFKFKKIPGSDRRELVNPDKKKYALYYQALEEHTRLENEWYAEDQRNLHRLIEIRGFLWT
jgi:hypothetical protein